MTIDKLKEKIIAKIMAADDRELLEHIFDVIEFEHNDIHQMSQEEIEAVNEGLEQIRNGQWITHEESNRQIEEWLKSKGQDSQPKL